MNPNTLFLAAATTCLLLSPCRAQKIEREPEMPVPVAYYFPNWHRQPGQTGERFGEWPNVARAVPRFPGHPQPKRPLWGVEDEADPAVMAKKIDTAAEHGVGAFLFCWYYHEQGPYLDRALNEGYLGAANRSRLPFALMWANHDLGGGTGRKGAVSREVFERMGRLIIDRYFRDAAYWRLDGACYFSIYQPRTFLEGLGGIDAARSALAWFRQAAAAAGAGPLHLNLVDFQLNKEDDRSRLVRELGADSATSYVWIHDPGAWRQLAFPSVDYPPVGDAYFASWDRHWKAGRLHFPNVTMGWDPTPRLRPDQPHTGKGYPDTPVITGNTPERFRAALEQARNRALSLPNGRRVVTIYAWNEWTEGGYLEPDQTNGMKYLEAVRDVFRPTGAFLPIPTIDISGETERHSFVALGTEETYQGHVDTVLMPDGKTMWAAWAINHAGHLGPLAKSEDAGRTWTDPLPTPPSWKEQRATTPTIHRLVDPAGMERLFVFAGQDFPGRLRQSYSEDQGKTWTPMLETGLKAECPPKTILAFDGGKRLVMWCDRRDPESSPNQDKDPVVWQSESRDGGLTWSPERVVVKTASRWSQPAVIASGDGATLLMLLRNNFRDYGQFAVSRNRGESWSETKPLPLALTGHRHALKRAPNGRLVVVMRDTARDLENGVRRNPTFGHFVAWVGTFDDILEGRDGQYRIKLLHSYAGSDTGYSGLELLPDGTFVATTYVKFRPGPEKHSVVSTRFRLDEIDARVAEVSAAASLSSDANPPLLPQP